MKGTIVNKKKVERVKENGERKLFVVDAAGRTLGRVASEAAAILLGKKSVMYAQNAVMPVEVKVINAAKLRIPERRMNEKTYRWFTGEVDGLREITLPNLIAKKGIEYVVEQTIDGMLPRNGLRKERMKRLSVIK